MLTNEILRYPVTNRVKNTAYMESRVDLSAGPNCSFRSLSISIRRNIELKTLAKEAERRAKGSDREKVVRKIKQFCPLQECRQTIVFLYDRIHKIAYNYLIL
jgi:hypothetical protein